MTDVTINRGGRPSHQGGTSLPEDFTRHRALISLDGFAMTEMANICAVYALKCKTNVDRSTVIRRALDLLHGEMADLMDKPDSDPDVLAEQHTIRERRRHREGLAGWSRESRKQLIHQPATVDLVARDADVTAEDGVDED